MAVLFSTHPRYLDHDAGAGHPERPARLEAVLAGVGLAGYTEALTRFEPRRADRAELEAVHQPAYLDALARFCAAGGGSLDPDTGVTEASWDAAVLAAGAGLRAVELLREGVGDAAFCAVRPPGHHATPTRSMGFCLLNNVAVVARALAASGERVLVVDYDAHHGNGTQDAFYAAGDVAYVSLHEWPLYPGTGAITETGAGAGEMRTMNLPLPAGATGDVYLAAVDRLIAPFAEAFAPTWLVLSAGFDAHRRDPLTGLSLTSGDIADLTARLLELVAPGRRLVVLEGGYDLQALADCTGAVLGALLGESHRPEAASSGGPGRHVLDAASRIWADHVDTGA